MRISPFSKYTPIFDSKDVGIKTYGVGDVVGETGEKLMLLPVNIIPGNASVLLVSPMGTFELCRMHTMLLLTQNLNLLSMSLIFLPLACPQTPRLISYSVALLLIKALPSMWEFALI